MFVMTPSFTRTTNKQRPPQLCAGHPTRTIRSSLEVGIPYILSLPGYMGKTFLGLFDFDQSKCLKEI
jgi:hypothetical protein